MKKILTLFFSLLIAATIVGQVPQSFKYQAVLRDNNGLIIDNQAVTLRISLFENSTLDYQETHAVTTNDYGLINISVGNGTVVSGDFSLIDWGTNDHFIQVEVDDGSGYVDMGTTQLLSVPYALHANTVDNFTEDDPSWDGSNTTTGDIGRTGNVGIGTTTPTAQLHTTGSVLFAGAGTPAAGRVLTSDASGNASWQDPASGTTCLWTENVSDIYRNTGNVGIGTTTIDARLHVDNGTENIAVKAVGQFSPTNGYLGVQGSLDFDGITTLDISGNEIGVLGVSTGLSTTDNYGVYGHSNGWGGKFEYEDGTKYVELGGSSYALRIVDGNEAAGKVLTSDASGFATWQSTPSGSSLWTASGSDIYYNTGNTSIGTTSNYGERLYIVGDGTNRPLRVQVTSGITKLYINPNGGTAIGSGVSTPPIDGLLVGGNIDANGTKNFKIDHPQDPENKWLYHAAIESDQVLNKYSGNVVTDANGYAIVELADYVELVNKDFRYSLTVIGVFAQAIIKEELANGKFVIQTDQPNVKVSWEITGIRNDTYMQEHPFEAERIKEEVDKTEEGEIEQ